MEMILELINRDVTDGIRGKKFKKSIFLLIVAVCLLAYGYADIPVYSENRQEESRSFYLLRSAEGISGSVSEMTERNLADGIKEKTLPAISGTMMKNIIGKVHIEEAVYTETVNIETNHIKAGDTVREDIVTDNEVSDDTTADESDTDTIMPIEIDGFLCNASGYITGYTDVGLVLRDSLLILPADPSCKGVAKGAFAGLEDAMEVYIPANICEIEAGAFEELPNLFFIEAAPDSSTFYSENGILYYRDGTVAVCPKGR